MAEHSPTPWRVGKPNYNWRSIIWDAIGSVVTTDTRDEDARLIVEAVNATGAWREERRRMELAAASAERAFVNSDARRTLLERYYCEVYADRDRLRDIVRRLTDTLQSIIDAAEGRGVGRLDEGLVREAREALGEDKP